MSRTLVLGIAILVGLMTTADASSTYTPRPAVDIWAAAIEAALERNATRIGVSVGELTAAYTCLATATEGNYRSPEDLIDVAASIELTAGANPTRRAGAVKAMCDLVRASSL
jgi:hypothetical protein